MKNKMIIFFLLGAFINLDAQNIGFVYDADRNMEGRYIVQLRVSEKKQAEECEESMTDIESAEFNGKKISIYPNPTKGIITIKLDNLDNQEKNSCKLYDMKGQLMFFQEINRNETEIEIDGDNGVYLLDIYIGEKISKWKILKQ